MNIKTCISLLCGVVFSLTLMAQSDSKWPKVDVSPMDSESYPAESAWRNYLGEADRNMRPKMKLVYSRPMKKGRVIFGELVPYGENWRLGANEATEIQFYKPVAIDGMTVPAGVYTMNADVQSDKWTIHFSTQRGIWGSKNADPAQRVVSITVPVQKASSAVEALSMTFREMDPQLVHLAIQWDDTRVEVPIQLNPVVFSELDKSPMDKAHYPPKSAYTNYLEGQEASLTPKIIVSYSRPYKKDRDVFGSMLKTGDVWRVGANQSTEMQIFERVKIGDTELRPGSYALYAELKEGSWDLILNSDLPAWGAANRREDRDVARINVPTSTTGEVIENLSIVFEEKGNNSVHMIIAWDDTQVALPITFVQ